MFIFRALLAFTAAAGALATPLQKRANTNGAINDVVDALDIQIHQTIPVILTLQANHTASDATIGVQIQALIAAFTSASTDLTAIPISSGSTTDKPTNDDISITMSDIMQQVASGLSGLTTATVPSFTSLISQLDTPVVSTLTALNTTSPNSIVLIRIMMRDAKQFLVQEGGWPATVAILTEHPATGA